MKWRNAHYIGLPLFVGSSAALISLRNFFETYWLVAVMADLLPWFTAGAYLTVGGVVAGVALVLASLFVRRRV
jgi:hypothetical protein